MKKLIATAALGLSMLIASPAFAYEVQSGDTMGEIAKEKQISLQELSKINPQVRNLDLIYVGQNINIPGEVKARSASVEKASTSVDGKSINVVATAYTAYCNGCSGITSAGIDLRSNPNQKVIAVDPNIIPLGTKVYVPGYGVAIAGDTGGAIKGNRIDIFIPDLSKAYQFGRQTLTIKVLD